MKIKFFYSKKSKDEQDLKSLSLGQLQALVSDQSSIDVIIFKSKEEYLKAKDTMFKQHELNSINQILMIIESDKNILKKYTEVHHV